MRARCEINSRHLINLQVYRAKDRTLQESILFVLIQALRKSHYLN